MKELLFRRPVDGALYLFDRGYKVFPLRPGEKVPAVSNWQGWADSATENKITSFGTANPLSNWGVSCGPSGLIIVDIDNKNGISGEAGFKALGREVETLTVLTPSGGRHLYYEGQGRNTASAIAEGVDTRGDGGYVVAPGSRIGDDDYRIINSISTAPVPSYVLEKLAERKEARVITEDAPIIEGERNQAFTSLAGFMRHRGFHFDAIYAAMLAENALIENPLPEYEIRNLSASVARYKPEDAPMISAFKEIKKAQALCVADIHPSELKRRDWVMTDRYLGGFLSVLIAPGGVGKSTLGLLDAIAICSGKPITGFDIKKRGAVWVYNTEDPMDELERRVVAASIHHKIPLSDLSNLFFTSGADQELLFAKTTKQHGFVVNERQVEEAIAFIKEKGIVLFLVDPFVRAHACDENSNEEIDKVSKIFQRIAKATGCAVAVVHHANKAGAKAEEGDVNISRGASALTNAARIAHTMQTMKRDEAKGLGIPEEKRRWYVRFDNAKANLQPPAAGAYWFQKVSVPLMGHDDTIGCLETVTLADAAQLRRDEEAQAEREDLAYALNSVMAPGDMVPMRDVTSEVFEKPKYAHLFNRKITSPDRRLEHLKTLFMTGEVTYGDKVFEYDKKAGRQKNFITCFLKGWGRDVPEIFN